MVAILIAPVIIHTARHHEFRIEEIVVLRHKAGPFLGQFDPEGATATMAVTRVIHDGDRLAWTLRMCSSAEGVLDVKVELVAANVRVSAPFLFWTEPSVRYRSGECQNVTLRAVIPISAPPGRYELRPELRMVLASGRPLVGELAPLPFVVAGNPPR